MCKSPNLNPSAEFAPIQPIPKAEEARVTGAIFAEWGCWGATDLSRGRFKGGRFDNRPITRVYAGTRSNNVETNRASTNDVLGVMQLLAH